MDKFKLIFDTLEKHSSFIKTVVILLLLSRLCYVESSKLNLVICLLSGLFAIINGIKTDTFLCKNLSDDN